MLIRNRKQFFIASRIFLATIVAVFALGVPQIAQAAQITGRSITLSNSAGAATGVTYSLATAALPTATAVKSVGVQFCDAASGTCNAPTGFSASSSTLSSQPTGLGAASGWTVNAATANQLRIVNAANATVPSGAVAIVWGGVVNPTANNTTYYARITTYSDAAWTTSLDSGTVALSTAQQITVTASVNETLTFCTGTSITGQNCGTVAGTSVALGTLTSTSTGSGTSVMAASTNASTGYTISINGTTLTSGGNTIDAITAGAGATSSQGSEQFGISLRDNATPNIGADPTGASGFTYGTGYGTVDSYKFVTGNTVVSQTAAANASTYTVSYIANIAGITEPGSYSATFTYIATANY
jgi:hypothetical protein